MSESLGARIYHKFLLIVAIVVVFCAVVFTVTRLLTPVFNVYRTTFERWSSHALKMPVTFSQVSFDWRGIEPEMLLTNVKFYDSKTKALLLNVHKVYVSLNLFGSLWHRKLEPEVITLAGTEITVKKLPDGSFSLNNLNLSRHAGEQGVKSTEVLNWALTQPAVYLNNITFHYQADKHYYGLHVASLGLRNLDKEHVFSGRVNLLNKPTSANFVVKLTGKPKHWRKDQLSVYAELNHVVLSPWLKGHTFRGYSLSGGYGDAKLWAERKEGHWLSAHSQAQLYDLKLHSLFTGQDFMLSNLSATMSWQAVQGGWRFDVSRLDIITDKFIWPITQLLVTHQQASNSNLAKTTVWLNFAELGDVSRLLQGSSLLPQAVRRNLYYLNLSGDLNNISLVLEGALSAPSHYQLTMDMRQVSMEHWQHYPGVKGLSGRVSADNQSGALQLQAMNTNLYFGGLFPRPLALSHFSGKLTWQKQTDGQWLVRGQNLVAANPNVGISAAFALRFLKGHSSPYFSLLAGYRVSSPLVVKRYLPVKVISAKTVKWLNQAFLAGAPLKGTVMLRGALDDFPFIKNKGVFQVDTKVKNLTLHFADGWPVIKHINGDLLFANRSMIIRADSGQIMGAKLWPTSVIIPVIAKDQPTVLMVNTVATDQASDLYRFINATPLKKSLAATDKELRLEGPTKLALHITLPLDDLHAASVSGDLILQHNNLLLPAWQLEVHDLIGRLSFKNDDINAKQLHGIFFDKPITASIHTAKNGKFVSKEVHFKTSLTMASLVKHYPSLANLPVKGEVKLAGKLSLHADPKDSALSSLILKSDLYGLTINLPAPLAKPLQAVMPSTFKVTFGHDQPIRMLLSLQHYLTAALRFNWLSSGKLSFYSGELRFGSSMAKQQLEPGLLIDGSLASFNLSNWKAYLNKQASKKNLGDMRDWKARLGSWLRKVNVQVNKLSALGLKLSPVVVQFEAAGPRWLVTLLSNTISGTLSIPEGYPNGVIDAQFKKIHLPDLKSMGSAKLQPKNIPAFKLSVADFSYGPRDFGRLNLAVYPFSKGLTISSLHFYSPWLSGVLHGKWYQLAAGASKSQLAGTLASNNLTTLLDKLHIKSTLLGKQTYAKFALSWPGVPFKPKISELSGVISLAIHNGWVVDLSKATTEKLNLGRLLTLLSVRHLMLQFSDLSHSGYNFDKLTTDLSFNKGELTTHDFIAHGPIADIRASGSVNLLKQLLQLHLTIGINATSSLPVVATIASGFNPLVGIATFIATKVAHNALEKITTYSYAVSGSWHDPKIIKLNKK